MSAESPLRFFPSDVANDPDRIKFLFEPVQNKSNTKMWENAIQEYLLFKKVLTFDLSKLLDAFTLPDDQKPQCLEKILRNLAVRGVIVGDEPYFLSLREEKDEKKGLVARIQSWLRSRTGTAGIFDPNNRYIWPGVAEDMVRSLHDHFRAIFIDESGEGDSASANSLYWDAFFAKCSFVAEDEWTFLILITLLSKQGLVNVTVDEGKEKKMVSLVSQ